MNLPRYTEILKEIFREELFFIDIGAFTGEITERLLNAFPKAKGILFEPTEKSYTNLQRKFATTENVMLFNFALGDKNSEKDFYQYTDAAQNSVLKVVDESMNYEIKLVQTRTLDSVLESTKFLPGVDFIKIDTQGNDLSVLLGAMETIKKHNPVILTECIFFSQYSSQGSYYDQLKLMNEFGYKLAGVFDAHYDKNGFLAFSDLLFIPASLLNKINGYPKLSEKFISLDVYHLYEQNVYLQNACDERLNVINNMKLEFTKLLKEKEKQIREKEKERVFLGHSLGILKKRLSNPIFGLITVFQHTFPGIWEFLYRQKKKHDKKLEERKKIYPVGFFTPRLGKLHHHPPREINIDPTYGKEKLKSNPLKISIVTPSYNQGEFLRKTIKSVEVQNYDNFEYIIFDSCSTDNSKEVLNGVSNPGIKYFIEKDKGQADAIQKGFKESSGEIMAWINSDDIYLPGTFNYVVNYFNEHPDADVVYGHRILIDTEDREVGRWVLPKHDKNVLYYADFIPQETLFWRRRIWEKVGADVNVEFNFAIDWDLLLRFQEAGAKIVRLPRFLAAFRVHPLQKTSAQINSVGETEMNLLRRKYLGEAVSFQKIKSKILFYLIKSEILNKFYITGIIKY